MAELSGEHLIEIRAGSAKPEAMRVRPGEPLGPMSVGSEGAWRLEAPGVAAEHAEIYFDGKELFVRSMNAIVPAIVEGRSVPDKWTSVTPPCEIAMGDARIGFTAATPGAHVAAPQAAAPGAGMFEDDDNVETRVADVAVRPWGDVSALVQRGIDVSRMQRSGAVGPGGNAEMLRDGNDVRGRLGAAARAPAPRPAAGMPATPEPPRPFFPAAPAPPGEEMDSAEGPSRSGTTDNSAMTRIEPVDKIASKRKTDDAGNALKTSGSYPQAALPSGSYPQAALPSGSYPQAALPSGHYPQAALPSGHYPQAALPSGSYPQAALPSGSYPQPQFGSPSGDDGFPNRGYGSTIVLEDGPPTASQGGAPAPPPSQPMFGAPPPLTGPHPLQTGASLPLPTLPSGTSPLGIPNFRLEQPASIDGLVGATAPGAKPGMSLPKKVLAALFLPMVASIVVIFAGEDLGLVQGPARPVAGASAKGPSGTAAPSAPAPEASSLPGEPTGDPAAGEPPGVEPPALDPPPEDAPTGDAPPVAPPSPSVAPAVAGTAPTAPITGVVMTDEPAPSSQPAAEKRPSGKTLQREAADAVAAGAYGRAADLYEELAKKYPNKPAYAEAVAILRAKAGGSR